MPLRTNPIRTFPQNALALLCAATLQTQVFAEPPAYHPSPSDLKHLADLNSELARQIQRLQAAGKPADLITDVAIYQKAAEWLLRYPEEFYAPDYLTKATAGVERGLKRASELSQDAHPWTTQNGHIARGYRSRVDASVQPYALSVPASYDPARPIRLDVYLHGRNAKLTEATFLAAQEGGKPIPPDQSFLQLDVYGRGNNSYFWAGETDVFEAIASVRAHYNIDPERIVLRGFSMGGTGTWELGLHHPSQWAAVECGAGYAETRDIVLNTVTDPRLKSALTIHNPILSVRNMVNAPMVVYAGEEDPLRKFMVRVQEELGKLALPPEELRVKFLIGPKTGHRFHPDSKKESDAFIDQSLPRHVPEHFRFICYTPRYGSVWGIHVDTLQEMYQPALLEGSVDAFTTSNVAALTLDRKRSVIIDGQKLEGAAFERKNGVWKSGITPGLRKRANLQGPIDDAFQDAFVCVRPVTTDAPVLDAFGAEFAKFMRGDVRVKKPAEVTDRDIADFNLVLFGTPWSNPLIAKVLPGLPVRWSKERIELAGKTYPAQDRHVVMIYPNPLNPNRYVVLNSGNTFHGPEGYTQSSWFLYPRLGDYAVVHDDSGEADIFGYFDRNWKLP
jgi:dienelactone hydrolase